MRAVLLDSPELDAYGQMALDEALLNSGVREAILLRFYHWPGGVQESRINQIPTAVTFGYFQSYEDVEKNICARGLSLTFPLVRRLTGGGIVYHDGDITFSVVFPWSRLETASWIYKNMHRGIHLGLKALGLQTQMWSPPLSRSGKAKNNLTASHPQDSKRNLPSLVVREGGAGSVGVSAVCFIEPSPMDLVGEDGKKILGGALRRRTGAGLYQGSMRPEVFKMPQDRLIPAIVEGVSLEWKVLFRPEDVDEELLGAAERLRRNRYVTDQWNKRR